MVVTAAEVAEAMLQLCRHRWPEGELLRRSAPMPKQARSLLSQSAAAPAAANPGEAPQWPHQWPHQEQQHQEPHQWPHQEAAR